MKSTASLTSDEAEPNWKTWILRSVAGVLATFLVLTLIQAGIVKLFGGNDQSLGLSGDFFGFANSVFSALAFAFIIVTLYMQKHELSQQSSALKVVETAWNNRGSLPLVNGCE